MERPRTFIYDSANPVPALCNMDAEAVLLTHKVCGETRNVVVFCILALLFSGFSTI
jgi:hypothetical protein